MPDVTEHDVEEALRAVMDPDLHRDIVMLGFVKNIRICEGNVAFTLELTTPACPVRDQINDQAKAVVAAIPGVKQVNVELTAAVRAAKPQNEDLVPGVKHVIAVASGKGGVGKSTVSVNLAVALAQTGARVGLLDADIYGPSLPLMMGADERPLMTHTPAGDKIVPVQAHGLLMMSLGFLLDADRAVPWRGPMVSTAVRQLFSDVTWGELDYLVVDLPPGTGDAPMTVAQLARLSGVVVVMTPQVVAQEIARKSILMFRMLETADRPIPILGIVENMSGGVFGTGGGESAAARLDVPFLGRVPLNNSISAAGDSGRPAILVEPDSPEAHAFRSIAAALASRVSTVQYENAQSESQPATP